MRRLAFLIAGAGLALVIAAPAVVGNSDGVFRAWLNGYLEVPSISTTSVARSSPRSRATRSSTA